MSKPKKLIIACDGESASGKSTAAKLVSKKYKLLLINSGLIYRYCSKLTIQNKPKASQRELADELGFSLGKLNYCLRALKHKGLVKIQNFRKNPKKLNYIYVLTPKGIAEKTKITINLMLLIGTQL